MQNAQTFLEVVKTRGQRRQELHRVYRHLQDRELFLQAYGKLYANAGALTPGTDPNDTADGMSLKRIDDLIEALKAGTYRWKPVRRVNIPKTNGKTRPLGIPSWNDKLLQEVIRIVLSAYYESQFSEMSHGFRPGKGCHTALQTIKRKFIGVRWFIEGDIKGCFDNIDHEKLVTVIARNIKDERFLKLIRGMLAAGYMEDWRYKKTYSGTPQGGVLSPLLANIFLDQLDTFVEQQLIPQNSRGKIRAINPEYQRLQSRLARARASGKIGRSHQLRQEMQAIPSRTPDDPDFRRLTYVRYADDFLVGFIGPKAEALEIKREIKSFLEDIGLKLSEEKTLITHAQEQAARFLGYEISTVIQNDRQTGKRRSINLKPMLKVPQSVVKEWSQPFLKDGKPSHRPELLNNSDYDIVTKYAMQLRGIVNYYALAYDVSSKLNKIKRIMTQSLVKTLANKHRLSVREVHRRYKQTLPNGYVAFVAKVPREGQSPLIATYGGYPIRHQKVAELEDTKKELMSGYHSELVQRLLANKCELCGADENVEVHHVRKLSDLKRRYGGRRKPPEWVKRMVAMRRKTLAVCQKCHHNISSGGYDGPKLRRSTGEPDAIKVARPVRGGRVGKVPYSNVKVQ